MSVYRACIVYLLIPARHVCEPQGLKAVDEVRMAVGDVRSLSRVLGSCHRAEGSVCSVSIFVISGDHRPVGRGAMYSGARYVG